MEQNPFIDYLSTRLKRKTLVGLHKPLSPPSTPLSYSSLPIHALQKRNQSVLPIINMTSLDGEGDTQQASGLAPSTVPQKSPDSIEGDLNTRVPEQKEKTPSITSTQSPQPSADAVSCPPSTSNSPNQIRQFPPQITSRGWIRDKGGLWRESPGQHRHIFESIEDDGRGRQKAMSFAPQMSESLAHKPLESLKKRYDSAIENSLSREGKDQVTDHYSKELGWDPRWAR